MSYLQAVVTLATYAATHPKEFAELWQLIVEAWQSAQALAKKAAEQFSEAMATLPRDAEISGTAPDVLAAEEQLIKAIELVPTPRASTRAIFSTGNGNLRKVIGELLASPFGKFLLQQILNKVGIGS